MSEIKPISDKLVKVKLNELHVRYIPVVTPLDIWKKNMNLMFSPHLHLMENFEKYGFDLSRLKKTDYYEERKYRYSIGMKRWTEEKIREHLKDRYNIFISIKKYGYDKNKDKANPIKVLKTPFWKSRFNLELPWLGGMEIWNGAGRCSAALFLGYKELPVLMVRDTRPGTMNKGKFESKLRGVNGVW